MVGYTFLHATFSELTIDFSICSAYIIKALKDTTDQRTKLLSKHFVFHLFFFFGGGEGRDKARIKSQQ